MTSTSFRNRSVCLVPLTNGVSGTERVVGDIATALADQGAPPQLIVPTGEQLDKFGAKLQQHSSAFARIGQMGGKARFGRNFWRAFQLFRAWQPQIVHFHCPHYRWGIDVVLAAQLARVPTIIRTEHNPLMGPPGRIYSPLLRLTDSSVSAFTYVSRGNMRRFETLLPRRKGRGRVINNGINPQRFNPNCDEQRRRELRSRFGFPPDTAIAVYVGGFGERRSLRTIFEAMHRLRNDPAAAADAQRWRLLVIGAGPEDERRIPHDLGIDAAVVFAGRRSDVDTILPSCDLFVTASSYEGMSIAVLEAWASGLPVLATKVDGIDDVLGEQTTFATVEIGDSEQFARAWRRFMVEPEEVRTFHKEACRRVREEYTTDRMLANYLALYG